MNPNDKKNNRYAFFEYNGKYYGLGTIVKFKSNSVRSLYGGAELYGKYYYGCSYDDSHSFKIGESPIVFGKCVKSIGNNESVSDIIEEVITPIEVPYVSYAEREKAVSDWEDGELILWWVIYLLIIFGSCIFVFWIRIFLWTVASFIFWGCRHEKLKEYGYK